MRKWILLLFLGIAVPVQAQNLDNAIQELTKDVKGEIVSPATTEELQQLFKDADETKVPRIFVDKLPSDFSQKGTGELYMYVIAALILRSNETTIKEKMLLTLLKKKYENKEPWTEVEESFFQHLVEKYDVVINKTTQMKLDQLTIKVDEIVPGLAVAQSVYATNWGQKNMDHPYGQMGWLDENTYAEIPYDSLIKATEAYVKEMNSTNNYWMWRNTRQMAAHKGYLNLLAYNLAGNLQPYRPEDPYYSDTIQKVLINNAPLRKLHTVTFIQ
ncbi:MAG: hypothetical protein II938_04905 [Alphaproteobacteria bacterium]|nr:hypothetical protein [Alphaproteobacteria bacterium]